MRNAKYTITDVAKMLDVSRATVSRALSGAPGVGPELRKKIIDFADEIGYKPNPVAQSLSKGKMKTIGLIYGDVRNPFYAELTYYIQKGFNEFHQKACAAIKAGKFKDEILPVELKDIDMVEINEAFASHAYAVARDLGLDREKVNIYGGGQGISMYFTKCEA